RHRRAGAGRRGRRPPQGAGGPAGDQLPGSLRPDEVRRPGRHEREDGDDDAGELRRPRLPRGASGQAVRPLLLAAALLAPGAARAYDVTTCPDHGIAQPSGRSGGDPTLNTQKNRTAIPPAYSTVTWSDASWNQPVFPKP